MSPDRANELHYERRGSGDPLVLLHGLGGSIVVWRPVIDLLAAERDVIALDLPGFGRSPALDAGFVPSAVNLAGVIAQFLSGLGIERPAVAGNSLGAWVGLEMALQGNASAVVAISPAGLWRRPLGPRRFERHTAARALRPLVTALLRSRRGRTWMLATTVARPDLVPAADARELIVGYLGSTGYLATNEMMRSHVFERAAEIRVPVTIAWGARDRTVGRPSRTRMPEGARYVEVPDWGHTPSWDDPEGVAKLILEATAGAAQVASGRSSPGQAPVAR